jgi:acetyltransferase-like isoleucine patch superfamily enzyme
VKTTTIRYQGDKIPYDSDKICKDVIIGDNVWIGDWFLILPGSVIGEGVIIQAGSVVSGSVESLGIARGNPAKIFKYRDRTH